MVDRWLPPDVILLGALSLAAACALAVAFSGATAGELAASAELQRATGGLGLGRAVDLSRCAAAFDPRVSSACVLRHEPLAGTQALCPDHSIDWPASAR